MTDQLIIGGVPYGGHEALDIRQDYTEIDAGKSHRRAADGTLITQCFWSKLKTTIAGTGWVSPGIGALDHHSDYVVKCLGPRTISSTSTVITIPAARRSDIDLDYTALVDDVCVPATASITDNDVTFTAPVGAQAYRVSYAPEFTARLISKRINASLWGAVWDWALDFEEI